jgi:endoglucanase
VLGAVAALSVAALGAMGLVASGGEAPSPAQRSPAKSAGRVGLGGLNISGAEFAPQAMPGVVGKNYVYPTDDALRRYAALGVRVARLPVRWERVQRALNGPLDPAEMGRIDRTVAVASAAGMQVVLDIHNYGRYRGRLVTEPNIGAGFADLWQRLSVRYRGKRVAFGLMNEPFGIGAREWRAVAERAVTAIRRSGADNLILVPGTRWTGAHSWTTGGADSNAAAFEGFRDRNFAYELHQYLDRRSSGTEFSCPGGDDVGARRLAGVTAWLRAERARGFLGEFAAGRSAECQKALATMLGYMDRNADVWMGWTYWTAGPWWPPRYEFGVEPRTGRFPAEATALNAWFARR